MKRKLVYLTLFVTIMLSGCAKQAVRNDTPMPSQDNTAVHGTETTPSEPTGGSPSGTEKTDTMEKEIVPPTKDEVLAAREQVLKGMTEEQIDRLYTVVLGANDWWERQYLWHDIFSFLEDPNDPAWNYFDKTGEINVQWFYDGDEYHGAEILKIMEREGLSWTGFCEKYGTEETLTPLIVNNEYNADGFIEIIEGIKDTVQDGSLKNDLQAVIDKTALARDTHDMYAANDLFKLLHDLDYFLLRYGPEDIGTEVRDASFVSKYFGMLSTYG